MPEYAKETYASHVTVEDAQTVTGAKTFSGGAVIKGSSVAPTSGYVGEEISDTEIGNTAINTSTRTEIVSVTLTVGVWSVSGAIRMATPASITGLEALMATKGVDGTVYGKDVMDNMASAVAVGCSITFPTRVVVIVSGDATKTVAIKAKSFGANATATGWLSAIRIA
jgi:hypothetical protein